MKNFLLLFLLAVAARAQTPTPAPTPRPPCYEPGWYQRVCDNAWQFADPSHYPATCPSCCGSHHLLVADDTGAWVTIIGQCPDPAHPCVGFQNVYKKPDHPSEALTAWNYYYTDPDAALHRHLFHYNGPGVPPPGLQVLTPYKTLAQVPDPPRAAFFAAYDCEAVTTPTRTGTPGPVTTRTRTPTPAPSIYTDWIYQFVKEGFSAGCGPSTFCPGDPVQTQQGLVTRGQEAVFSLKAEHGTSYVPPKCNAAGPPPVNFTDVPCP